MRFVLLRAWIRTGYWSEVFLKLKRPAGDSHDHFQTLFAAFAPQVASTIRPSLNITWP
jgi:hypothetical protein